jgi:DNA-binding PadR family transcriptional regulator
MDVQRDFERGAVQLHVLHHAVEGEIHGTWMIDELLRHGYPMSPGTLYPMLHRLEAGGMLRSRRTVVNGRVRRLYRATATGRDTFRNCQRALRELAHEVLGPWT